MPALRARSLSPIDPDQLIRAVRQGLNSSVNPGRQTAEIRVERAEDDSAVTCGSMQMESKEMPAIVRYQDAPPGGGKGEHFRIGHRRVGISRFERCQHIMAKTAQFRHHLQRDILVGIKVGQYLSRLVVEYLAVYFGRVRARVVPGVHQILRAQRRVGSE